MPTYYPDTSAAELAHDDPCAGAKPPFVHSHFFDASGRFGSLDENENPGDEGRYEIIDSRTIRIGGDQGVKFNYEIDGNTLMLSPVVTAPMVAEALASAASDGCGSGDRSRLSGPDVEACQLQDLVLTVR